MTIVELQEDIAIEFDRIDETLNEIRQILSNYESNVITRSDVTAGATYLAQCYTGIENILKRITKYCSVPLPSGSFWHADLVGMFKFEDTKKSTLPILIDLELFPLVTTLRKFRHTVAHGYAITFDKETVIETLPLAETTIHAFKKQVMNFLDSSGQE